MRAYIEVNTLLASSKYCQQSCPFEAQGRCQYSTNPALHLLLLGEASLGFILCLQLILIHK